jgi:hypothetical protein
MWDVRGFSVLKRFLESEISHKQALLLIAFYETVKCRALVGRHGAKAFKDASSVLTKEHMKFDFTTYPHMHEVFVTLPREIQDILRPYVLDRVPKKTGHDDDK